MGAPGSTITTPFSVSLTASTTNQVDDVLHASARLITGRRKYDHITLVLRDELHWLPMRLRIEYGLCLTELKALHGIAPVDILQPYVTEAANVAAFVPVFSRLLQLYFPLGRIVN